MKWISVKEVPLPSCKENEEEFVLAYHTIYGIGVAWFFVLESERSLLEEEFEDKYICSCQFIKNSLDGNRCIDDEDDIDIFEHSPHFSNLGTVTHWMPLPHPPE